MSVVLVKGPFSVLLSRLRNDDDVFYCSFRNKNYEPMA
jgi:hypothetical protein